ncbi:GDSL esterase/lipase [Hordeum vulgare]|nr:GDSL esterase/lipase [Hordeum vulgare]
MRVSFRRAPREGTTGLRNPGERNHATAGSDNFLDDVFFPDLGNLFINDMVENMNAAGSAPAAPFGLLFASYYWSLSFD